MERGHASPAEIYRDGYRIDEETRRACEVEIVTEILDEVQHAIDGIRPTMAELFGISLSGDEGPGFLRYVTGGLYRRHRDVAPGWDEEFPRRISIVLFLTTVGEQCEGGSLRLYRPEPIDVEPHAGTLVAFPSGLAHEVLPVTAGVRDVVVDWFF
jgi:predicted 2-oxoglutarate/Fe(II)-dependent dioxygenase YbiX